MVLTSSSEIDSVALSAHVEREVELALDGLEQTGALQKSNRMDIESLPNLEYRWLISCVDGVLRPRNLSGSYGCNQSS